jgi:ribosomal protein L17
VIINFSSFIWVWEWLVYKFFVLKMRVVYHKRPKGRNVKWSLSRLAIQRWHFTRTMVTQLFTHERIQTTYHKAKHIRPTAERVISIAKKFKRTENEVYFRQLESKPINSPNNFFTLRKLPYKFFPLKTKMLEFVNKVRIFDNKICN